MSKPKDKQPSSPPAAPAAGVTIRDPKAWGRETVESIVVAFTLALLFRGFEAEAFVIPTGSMANTLMGRHKDLVCEACGSGYRVGCSREFDEATGRVRPNDMVAESRCPNCGSLLPLLAPDDPLQYDARYPSFSGDRILVDKSAYDFAPPRRWDVVVFKYPEDAKTNYIKRLVGLPGETVSIAGGDVWTSRGPGDEPVIARKPAGKLEAMLQCVHDSDRVPRQLVAAGWPRSWCDWSTAAGGPACRWTTAPDGRSHAVTAPPDATATLRYRHLVAGPGVWDEVRAGRPVGAFAVPALIGDFQPYNAGPEFVGLHVSRDLGAPLDGAHWVGDLAVECRLESRAATGTVVLDLVEAGVRHLCTLDLATGRATLARPGPQAAVEATAETPVRGVGSWRLLFANVDDELSLSVDGRRVASAGGAAWTRPISQPRRPVLRGGRPGGDAADDLAPVGITATGADVTVADLRVLRDLYYIAAGDKAAMEGSRPEAGRRDYPLEADQFFMLGDNSSASKDGRAWGTPAHPLHHVDRRLLVGRALVVFWPHAVPANWSVPVRIGGVEVRLPSWPNLGRMRFIR